jgi:hypothetical protein
LAENHHRELDRLLDSFVNAIPQALFYPARLVETSLLQPPTAENREYRGRRFAAAALDPGAFRILRGMFAYYHSLIVPLDHDEAYLEGDRQNLLLTAAPYPPRPEHLPFQLIFSEPLGTAPPVLIRVEFHRALPPEDADSFLQPFATWNRLVCGGFPPDESPVGESGVGASETSFIGPTIVEHFVESHLADPRCFNLIVRMAVGWSNRYPIKSVRIE